MCRAYQENHRWRVVSLSLATVSLLLFLCDGPVTCMDFSNSPPSTWGGRRQTPETSARLSFACRPDNNFIRCPCSLPPSLFDAELLKRRFQIINLWRPISHAALDSIIDPSHFATSVDVKKDLMPAALIYPDREGETFGVKFNEAYKWKHMRGMEPEEFILIKW